MTNNDILRRIRYIFNLRDAGLVDIFRLGDKQVTVKSVFNLLLKEDEPDYKSLSDQDFAHFLNGFIVKMRGAKDGPQAVAESTLTNNLILRKLKIALNFRDDDIIEILDLADIRIGKSELSAFFRNTNHRHYRICKDQFLRNFLMGLQLKLRPKETATDESID